MRARSRKRTLTLMIGRGNPPWRNSCRESGDSRELSYFDVRSGRRRKERKAAREGDADRTRGKRLFFRGSWSRGESPREKLAWRELLMLSRRIYVIFPNLSTLYMFHLFNNLYIFYTISPIVHCTLCIEWTTMNRCIRWQECQESHGSKRVRYENEKWMMEYKRRGIEIEREMNNHRVLIEETITLRSLPARSCQRRPRSKA